MFLTSQNSSWCCMRHGRARQVGSLSVAAYGGPKTMASRVSYTSDGTVLVVGLSNGGVLVCTRQSPPQKQQQQAPNHHQGWAVHAHLTGHTAHVTGIALTQDGRRAYSSSTDNTVRPVGCGLGIGLESSGRL